MSEECAEVERRKSVLNTHCFRCGRNSASLFIFLGKRDPKLRTICEGCRLKYAEGVYSRFVRFEDFDEAVLLWQVQEVLHE